MHAVCLPAAGLIGGIVALLLVAIATTDAHTRTIPNSLVAGIAVVALLAHVMQLIGCTLPPALAPSLASRLFGAFACGAPLLACGIATGGIGGGDIKLMFAAGLLLGLRLGMLALGIGLAGGACWALALVAVRHLERGGTFALGPFLCAGIAAAELGGAFGAL